MLAPGLESPVRRADSSPIQGLGHFQVGSSRYRSLPEGLYTL